MEALDQLNNKLNLLLKKHAALETENRRLKATVAAQEKSATALSAKLSALEEGMVSVRLGDAGIDETEQGHMREQLDNVIGEIDKILNTLND